MNLRFLAAEILIQVLKGYSLSDSLEPILEKVPQQRDQALLQAICYGVCRWFYRLDFIIHRLIKKPLKEKDLDIYTLLLIGLYQLLEMRIPDYAAISETVSAATPFKKIWAKKLINGVLRNFQRHVKTIQSAIPNSPTAYYAHPKWMIDKIKRQWPEHSSLIFAANNAHPPFSLRINHRLVTRENYIKKLEDLNLMSEAVLETNSGVLLSTPIDALELPGFYNGEVFVQDCAAQLAVEILKPSANENILDAAAAPGGKTTHILQCEPNLKKLIAIDIDNERLNLIKDNLKRLSMKATCICADAANIESWWDGTYFDKILLDAPCSASGVIRRHPDIKLLRQSEDILKLQDLQYRLLTALWPLLKKGGILLYTTCSIFSEENLDVINPFLKHHLDAREEKINATWGLECQIGRQILPGMHQMDGFYFAKIKKI